MSVTGLYYYNMMCVITGPYDLQVTDLTIGEEGEEGERG
jgi:hypothetical protein